MSNALPIRCLTDPHEPNLQWTATRYDLLWRWIGSECPDGASLVLTKEREAMFRILGKYPEVSENGRFAL